MKTENYYINLCEVLGERAAVKGNSPVGAIIVYDNTIVSEAEEAGKTKNDITCHAELEAIRRAVLQLQTDDLSGCVLYSTHEPCIMCSYAIRFYKIKKVVYRHSVAYLGGASSSMPLLRTRDVPPHWNEPPIVTQVK